MGSENKKLLFFNLIIVTLYFILTTNNLYSATVEGLSEKGNGREDSAGKEYKNKLPDYSSGEVVIGLKEGFEETDIDALVYQAGIIREKSSGGRTKVNERIHKTDSVIKKFKEDKVSAGNMTDEQAFKEAYKGMPDYEKKLYRSFQVKLPSGISVEEAIEKLKNSPAIEYAQPNYLVELDFIPNDPYFQSSGSWGQNYDDLWGIKKAQCPNAWDISEGKDVIVAVIDGGVDYNHADISSNIWANSREIPGNGLDDDGNGYKDDVRGWDFSGDRTDGILQDNDPMDTSGHGTHVAGTIAAIGNNSIGVIGVAPKVKIMPVKIFPYSFDIVFVPAIKYAVDNKARVISCSWGGFGEDQLLSDILNYAYNKGVVSVVSAGNDNIDSRLKVPATYTSVITVAASDYQDKKADFSNYGVKIDVTAPGVDILSLKSSSNTGKNVVGSNYYRMSGTSMSTPHVSGLAALILSKDPTLKNEEVRQIIRQSSDDVDMIGWDLNAGYGRINAYKAVTFNYKPPVAHISSLELDKVNKKIIIKGSANSEQFMKYTVEYGSGKMPASWQIIKDSSTPVTENILAVLDLSNLKQNEYWFKLSTLSINSTKASQDRAAIYYPTDFVLQWGCESPSDIAVDEKNNLVYVSTYKNPSLKQPDVIKKFDMQSNLLKEWVVSTAKSIYVDGNGYIWAAVRGTPPIQKYDSQGNLLVSFGTSELWRQGIAVDRNGNIYLSSYAFTQPENSKISKFNNKGEFVMNIGSYGTNDGQFLNPGGIAIDGDYLYVTDLNSNKTLKFKTDGTFIKKWGITGTGDGQFSYPCDISFDGNSKLYITDSYNNRVQVFDTNGNFLYKFGSVGSGEGEFNMPVGIYADQNTPHKYVYVIESANNRIQKFKAFNRMPALVSIGSKTIAQGKLLKFEIKATDPDQDILAYGVNNLPSGAQFVTVTGEIPAQAQIPGLYGDVNLDGKINIDDVNYLFDNMAVLSEIQKITADVNGNGRADMADITMINEYASGVRNFFPVIVRYGDVNLDGKITVDDVNYLFAQMSALPEVQKIAADVNGNGNVDSNDVVVINDYVTGKRTSFSAATKRFFIWKPASTQVGIYPSVSFTLTDGKEIISESISISVIDDTAPTTPVVTDGGTYTSSKTSLYASWTSSDLESGIAQYQYKITQDSTASTAVVMKNWTSTGTTKSVTASGLTLTQGKIYYFSVQSKNGAGLWSAVGCSNGIKVDNTAASIPVVTDGGTSTISTTALTASWTSSDLESGIAQYQYKITQDSTASTAVVMRNWTSTGTAKSVTASGLTLIRGKKYYFGVQSKNGAGTWSAVGYSDGILVQ